MPKNQQLRKPSQPTSRSKRERRSGTHTTVPDPNLSTPKVHDTRVSYRQLVPWDLNYRTTFDRDKLEELKQQILQHGLTHNLVGRPVEDGRYEIIVGGRRTMALGELVAEGKWDPDAEAIPLQVRSDVNNADALVLAMGENRQREDVHFLEEAEGIRQAIGFLTEGKGPTRKNRAFIRLAEKMGVTPRWVQILHGLAIRLHADVKALIRERNLPLDVAKAFAIVPPEIQARHLPEITSWHRIDKVLVRDSLLRGFPRSHDALFDPQEYKGDISQVELYTTEPGHEAPFDGGTVPELFLDLDQFAKLQRAALEKKRAELATQYAFAELIEGTRLPPEYEEQYGVPDSETGILLLVDPTDWFVHEVEVKKATPASQPDPVMPGEPDLTGADDDTDLDVPGTPPSSPVSPVPDSTTSAPPLKKDHLYRVHRTKTMALQTRIASSPVHAMRLVISALLTPSSLTRIAQSDLRVREDWVLAPDLAEDLQLLLEMFGDLLSGSRLEDPSSFCPNDLYIPSWSEDTSSQVLARLADLPDSKVERLFSFLTAVRTGSFCDLNPKFGDSPAVLTLAQMLGLERAGTDLDEEFLAGYTKPHLVAVARACGIEDPGIEKRTMPEIRSMLLSNPGLEAFAPPELCFASTSSIQEALRGVAGPDVSSAGQA